LLEKRVSGPPISKKSGANARKYRVNDVRLRIATTTTVPTVLKRDTSNAVDDFATGKFSLEGDLSFEKQGKLRRPG